MKSPGTLDIRTYCRVALWNAEAQPAIGAVESEKMPLESRSIEWRELGREDHRAWI